ncbi:MAG: HAD-IIIC family phosphatase [Selenomonas ruminantium]|jgi:FkbH-like protein|uniref:HAD-IIIC family phosphatase n=1 Tax=Selenomonas ruminantium TaxID=971 RepID=A0A927WKP0_SELRU|nr:HAD-IIIC family phosphatase [Selenomonas ruminantium]MBE6084543.1 HAD-IIIC family phosphatase [Selenomonas ruminantium]
MNTLFGYPLDSKMILKKRKQLKRQLLEKLGTEVGLNRKIAILGGSTTHDVKDMLELFLLDAGIVPEFYESEYDQFWQDVMFDNQELVDFQPDIIYIHTSSRNIKRYPQMQDSSESVNDLLEETFQHFAQIWDKIAQKYQCPIIQNNFEPPFYRLLGNLDFTDIHGRRNFINHLNEKIVQYAGAHDNFYVNDIDYMAASYGLERWADGFAWHMYKYACAVEAIPELAYNLANIIKSLYGKKQKALVLDLDNTLWGGVVGDDGANGIEIGQETSMGQLYSEFQTYIKEHKDMGILLAVNSKNDEENARAGLSRPDTILRPEDFLIIKANWENKDKNILEIAQELNIGTDSLVFVDDNPVERDRVGQLVPEVKIPAMTDPAQYIRILDRSGYFEATSLSAEDVKRTAMYQQNAARKKAQASFTDYTEYLQSLDMKAEIAPFAPVYMSRIAQLTNKSNQFNLTTKRCTQADMEQYASNKDYITLYGKLTDKFGDNGVVSVVFGHSDAEDTSLFHIDLWLMSCRVLKRDMEVAMMDELVAKCQLRGIKVIKGYYYPTVKNGMVKEFYQQQGFTKVSEDDKGNTVWELYIEEYAKRNKVIEVIGTND